jgi:DNA mismatch repair protein MutL
VVTHDGKRLFDVEPGMDLRARVRRAFGAELAESLVEVGARDERGPDRHGDRLEIRGLVAPPRFARGDTSRQMWFANGRPLRDKLLVRCLKEAYRGVLFEGRQPVAFLELSIDPAQVDVNVHPAKSEVRFREERRVFGFALSALREAVARTDMATPGAQMVDRALRRGPGFAHPGQRGFVDAPFAPRRGESPDAREPFVVREVPGTPPALPERERVAAGGPSAETPWTERDPFAGPFLQVARTYLVRELDEGFEIVDQHALHERVTYEALLAEARAGRVERQRFLVPELVELAPADVEALDGARDALVAAGIEVAAFGPTTIAVSGLPARLTTRGLADLLGQTAGVVRRSGAAPDAEALLGEVLHSAACRASVMAGDRLSQDEIRTLLERAAELGHDQTCPHGRPTRVRFTKLDLEKAFLRRP